MSGVAAVPLLVVGCATARPIAPMDLSSAGYRDAALSEAELKNAGVAVLPLTTSNHGDAFVSVRTGSRLKVAIEGQQVCAVVLEPADVTARFDRDGVSPRFEKMIAELPERGALDRDTLDAMAGSTGCRYFLQSDFQTGMSYDAGSRAVTAMLHAQLWDAATGEVVWEGTGGAAALTNPPNGGTTDQAIGLAVNGLATVLAKDPIALPSPHDISELHHLQQMEEARVDGENAARADAAVTGLEIMADVLQIAAAIADIAD